MQILNFIMICFLLSVLPLKLTSLKCTHLSFSLSCVVWLHKPDLDWTYTWGIKWVAERSRDRSGGTCAGSASRLRLCQIWLAQPLVAVIISHFPPLPLHFRFFLQWCVYYPHLPPPSPLASSLETSRSLCSVGWPDWCNTEIRSH